MFGFHNLREMLAFPPPPDPQAIEQLRDRIAELEADNANLRRLDDTIRRNVRLFHAILQKSHEGILLLTPDLIVLRLIHSAVGYEEVELSGQPMLSLVHSDDAGRLRNAFSDLVSARTKCVSCEFRFKKRDGSWAWVSAAMTDMLDDPDIQAILLNAQNITGQKQLEEAAEKLESYRAAPEYAMFSKDLTGLILDWNPGAHSTFGYSTEEIVGQNIAVLLRSDLLAQEISTRDRIARGEEIPAFQTVRIRKDGRTVKINLRLAAVRDSSGTVKAITHLSHVID